MARKKKPVDILKVTKHCRGKFWRIVMVTETSPKNGPHERSVEKIQKFKCAEDHCQTTGHPIEEVLEGIPKLLRPQVKKYEHARRKHNGRVWFILQVRRNGKWRTAAQLNHFLDEMIAKRDAKQAKSEK